MKYYGFNFQWMYYTDSQYPVNDLPPVMIDKNALDTICEMGCNFVRLPLNYWFWIHDFKYNEPDENQLAKLDECVHEVISRGLHLSLNLHRAPGYCINGAEFEKDNLWTDKVAQDAFVFQWKMLSQRYSNYSTEQIDFDLLNEPPEIGQYGMTRKNHEELMRRTIKTIRSVTTERVITLDGLGGGNIAIPEFSDLNVRMSTRGYQPMALTHYKASWCPAVQGLDYPVYPDCVYDGKKWNKDTIIKHYSDWKKISDKGIPVHVGEMGCYNKIDNSLALLWFKDIFEVFNQLGWGFSFWEFSGAFGICNHNRTGARYKKIGNYNVDSDLYDLFIKIVQRGK